MRLIHSYSIILFLILFEVVSAQDNHYSVSLFGSYVTSSKIYYNYDAADPAQRDQFFRLSGTFGIGIDIRREFSELRLQVGISAEYIKTQENIDYVVSPAVSIPITDGFRAIPVEITGYFLVPAFLPKWQFTVGAGIGFYWGSRDYSYASVSADPLGREIGAGIHVVTGVEFPLTEAFGFRTQVKFRDVQFWSTEKFGEKQTIFQGRTLILNQEQIKSKILVDGMTLSAGIVYNIK